jgi:hypothetical protein
MRPPICEICEAPIEEEGLNQAGYGGLVEFKPSTEDKEVIARMQIKGWTGHPPNMGWFCKLHIGEARAHRHLPLRDAMGLMRKKIQRSEGDSYNPTHP